MADATWMLYCIAAYYGAKTRFAQDILSLKPKHCTCHFEPFGGLFSVGLRSTCQERVYNDLNSKLASLITALSRADTAKQVLEFMSRTEYSQEFFDYAKLKTDYLFDSLTDIEKAGLTWVTLLQSYNGCMKDFKGFSKGNEALRYQNTIAKKAEVIKLAEGVQVYNMSAFDLIPQYMNRQDCWSYIDSPYCLSTRKGAKAYECELEDEQQWQLVNMIVDAKGYIAVSGYRNDIYDSVLNEKNGWYSSTLRNVAKLAHISSGLGGIMGKRSRADEILWMNYPIEKIYSIEGGKTG